ncbi:MAG TPA: DUF559 domain-containing protein [Gammaproteobacteria bacterium]|nr:DUF559 domain-containing protein [Gammaproteobacteria bacterium]
MKSYKSSLKTAARGLRKNITSTEELIWSAVQKKLWGIHFHRQNMLSKVIEQIIVAMQETKRLVAPL